MGEIEDTLNDEVVYFFASFDSMYLRISKNDVELLWVRDASSSVLHDDFSMHINENLYYFP